LHFFVLISGAAHIVQSRISPDQLTFVRQGVRRMIFDKDQAIPLASLEPEESIGIGFEFSDADKEN
jgi:hypothetical protein